MRNRDVCRDNPSMEQAKKTAPPQSQQLQADTPPPAISLDRQTDKRYVPHPVCIGHCLLPAYNRHF